MDDALLLYWKITLRDWGQAIYPTGTKERALDRVAEGIPRAVVCRDLGVKKVTLGKWLWKARLTEPDKYPVENQTALQGRTVADVRIVLRRLDEGHTMNQIADDMNLHRLTIRRWRDIPRYREATLEYDPDFPYSGDDLMDRAVVAQHLCTQTPEPGERLDLLMAAVGYGAERDEFSIPRRSKTRRIH